MRYKIYFVLCVLCLVITPCLAQQPTSEIQSDFAQANQYYKENKYDEAIIGYQKILGRGLVSGELYYNLGNSYVKKEELGLAALNYERAKIFIPNDSDLRANYDYLRSLLGLSHPELAGNRVLKWLDRLFEGCGINFMTTMLILLYLGIFVILFLRMFFEGAKRFYKIPLFVVILLFGLSLLSLHRKIEYLRSAAVVVGRQVEAKFEPLESATTYFKLTQGSVVEIIEESSNWCKVKRADGKLGWISRPAVELISG